MISDCMSIGSPVVSALTIMHIRSVIWGKRRGCTQCQSDIPKEVNRNKPQQGDRESHGSRTHTGKLELARSLAAAGHGVPEAVHEVIAQRCKTARKLCACMSNRATASILEKKHCTHHRTQQPNIHFQGFGRCLVTRNQWTHFLCSGTPYFWSQRPRNRSAQDLEDADKQVHTQGD